MPFCVRLPVPVMPAVLKSAPCVVVFVRLKTSVVLDPILIALSAERLPVVPALPTCKTPASMLVAPVYPWFPEKTSVPLPLLVSAPVLTAEFPDMVKMVPLVSTLMPLVVPF